MSTNVFAAPLLPGKTKAWQTWIKSLNGPKAKDLADMNRRYGLTRHAAWLQHTPMGDLVVVLHEGPGADEFMPKLAVSENQFDIEFRKTVADVHGLDLNDPPEMPEPGIDSKQ